MLRARNIALLLGWLAAVAPSASRAQEQPVAAAIAQGAAPVDVCDTHERIVKFAREAGHLLNSHDAPYFAVKARLGRVNDRYVALHEKLAAVMPPKNDGDAEMLWRFDALGELLQGAGENLERQARELKVAAHLCGQDLAAYEAEFGEACSENAKSGCAEEVFARYCEQAAKRNKHLKVDEETELGFFKWPRFFDNHWAGPTRVGEAGEGWREEWTYGEDDEVWRNLGLATNEDPNHQELLALTEHAYSHYTMIDTKPLLARMLYNVIHGTMAGVPEQTLGAAVDTVATRIKRIMHCDQAQGLADSPERLEPPKQEATSAQGPGPAPVAGAE